MKKSKVGLVVLAHDNVFRVRQVITALARQNVPIALHIDAKTEDYKRDALKHFLKDFANVYFVPPISCEWGQWSIVQAQINSTKLLMKKEPELEHIYHISGSCLPLRPMKELEEFLGENTLPYDYIESVAIGSEQWVYDGLNRERVEFYHPFNWQSQRKRFDWNVKIQRAFKYKRKMPKDLTFSFGSQWWCLSTNTLTRIFDDPKFESYCRFFSKSWIPDESFFQTLARKHSSRIESRSLTYATFDNQGKPFLIYDDHIRILERLDRFFVRKIWRGADKLYAHFLNPKRHILRRDPFAEAEMQALHDYARDTCVNGRPGLLAQFRLPKDYTYLQTRTSYFVYVGFHFCRDQIYNHYYGSPRLAQMGYLYHPNRTETELTRHKTPKNAQDLHKFRDYQKLQFLMQRVWHSFPREVAFLAKPHHLKKMTPSMVNDKHCNLYFVKGAWLLELFQRKIENIERIRTVCRIEMRREELFMRSFHDGMSANVHVFDVSELLLNPEKVAAEFPEQLSLSPPMGFGDDFRKFLKNLVNNGVSLKAYDIQKILDNQPELIANDDTQIISMSEYKKVKNG